MLYKAHLLQLSGLVVQPGLVVFGQVLQGQALALLQLVQLTLVLLLHPLGLQLQLLVLLILQQQLLIIGCLWIGDKERMALKYNCGKTQ